MINNSKKDYFYARHRIEQLLMTVEDSEAGMESAEGQELVRMSNIVIAYEKEYFPLNP